MLRAGREVFLCTSPLTRSPWCVPEKLAWVEYHFGPSWLRRIIVTTDKTLAGDSGQLCVLVDDRDRITGLADPPPWQHVLFDAPYNRTKSGPRLSSWADWRQVLGPALAARTRTAALCQDEH